MNKNTLKFFYNGIDSFNSKRFYDAHEYFEEIWIEHDLDDRVFVQGLIQLSVAFFHITNNNKNGAIGLFKKSISKLDRYVDTSQIVVNINDVIKSTHDCYQNIQNITEINQFDWSLVPTLKV